jgi:hypothetical protein
MNELVVAFKNLIKDLNFKLGVQHEDYRISKAEHFEIDKEINARLKDAMVRFGVAASHLDNTLYPEQTRLEETIEAQTALVESTQEEVSKSVRERAESQEMYENECNEFRLTMEAIHECQELLRGLQEGSNSFVEVTRAQKNIKKLIKKLEVKSKLGRLTKALVQLAQEFADAGAVQKVLDLFDELEQETLTNKAELDRINEQEIATLADFVELCNQTIEDAENLIEEAQGELEVVVS